MKALSTFFPRILPYLPGCSEPLAEQALRNAAIEFCEAAQVLRQDLEPFNTVANVAQYDLTAPTNQHDICRVFSVKLDEIYSLQGVPVEAIRTVPQNLSLPRGFYTDRTDSIFTLKLTPTPDKAYATVVHVALRPRITATTLDDDLYNIWIDPLVAMTIAKLAVIPGQPFTNPGLAKYMESMASRQTVSSRIEGNYGLVRGSMRVRTRPFA